MKITECLNTEHGVFLTQLEFLEQLVKEKAPDEVLRGVTRTIARAVERHRHVEEKFLYPAILREIGKDFRPIQVMESEHEEIGRLVFEIIRGSAGLSTLVTNFIGVLRQHIMKEIQVLFPLSEERISKQELEQMACQCVEYVHETSGVPSHRRCNHE